MEHETTHFLPRSAFCSSISSARSVRPLNWPSVNVTGRPMSSLEGFTDGTYRTAGRSSAAARRVAQPGRTGALAADINVNSERLGNGPPRGRFILTAGGH